MENMDEVYKINPKGYRKHNNARLTIYNLPSTTSVQLIACSNLAVGIIWF